MAKKIGVGVDAGVLMFWILAGSLSAVGIIGAWLWLF